MVLFVRNARHEAPAAVRGLDARLDHRFVRAVLAALTALLLLGASAVGASGAAEQAAPAMAIHVADRVAPSPVALPIVVPTQKAASRKPRKAKKVAAPKPPAKRVAIATIFHNIQYFGFVWMFERERTGIMVEKRTGLQMPQRLVHMGAWKRWFGVALLYSLAICVFYLAAPKQVGLTLIYFLGFAHYIIDGHIWRGAHNKLP